MKVNFVEGTSQFSLELTPENPTEVNQLARFAPGQRKAAIKIETTFYSSGETKGFVTVKKHQHKNFGTIK